MTQAIEKLEQEFAARVGVRGAIATGFGRSALRLALEAVAVRRGDVLVPDFICAQVPAAVREAGCQPVFYPVRRDLTVDPADFGSAFTPQTRAAIAAHYFGRLLPGLERLAAVCRARGVPLVEDAALALAAEGDGWRAGTLGDVSVFSLTKSDWCYGGGMAASNSPEVLGRLRTLRREKLREYRWLSFRYGLLRRADFLANRPRWSGAAERAGRWLERSSGASGGNFYDAGRFDAALPDFAAARARRIVADGRATTRRRQEILRQLTEVLGGAGSPLFRSQPEATDAGSFLLLVCGDNRAELWVEQAAQGGVTLRRCWPAYQHIEGLRASTDLLWLAENLLVMEIHPQLAPSEIGRLTQAILRLAGG